MRILGKIINTLTWVLYYFLRLFVSQKKLESLILFHWCWWFEKHGLDIPKYFIGTTATAPSVTTGAATSIAATTATGNGEVTSNGGAALSARGFVFSVTSVNSNPLIGGTGVTNIVEGGTSVSTFSATLQTLTQATGYSYKAYGTNAKGTGYGSVQTFTSSGAVPTVALNSPADTSSTSDTTPTLNFTGTDTDGDAIQYQVQVDTANTFDSQGGAALSWSSNTTSPYSINLDDNVVMEPMTKYAQTVAGDGYKIASVKFYLSKEGTLSSTMVAKLYSNSSGLPGTVLATSDSINESILTATPTEVEFEFSGSNQYETVNSTTYHISIEPSTANTTNYVMVEGDYDGSLSEYYNSSTSSWLDSDATGLKCSFYTLSGTAPLISADSSVSTTGFTTDADGKYPSGTAIDYTVQTALDPDTYYWRVRGRDPDGSNTWGDYATTRSFTVTGGAAGTDMKINIGDTWKTVTAVKLNVGDVWKPVTKVQINVGDSWRTVF